MKNDDGTKQFDVGQMSELSSEERVRRGKDCSSTQNVNSATLDSGTTRRNHEGMETGEYTPGDSGGDADFSVAADSLTSQRLPADSLAGRSIGEYELISELGRGGMGVVFKARHRKLNRLVAIKMILAGRYASQESLSRFIKEAQAVARLQHSGIVQIFEIGEHAEEGNNPLAFFALEFVGGGDLQSKTNGEPQTAIFAANLVRQLAETMQYAHDNGILHRDLKPANVLLDPDGLPKISDFGLAREIEHAESGLTSEGMVVGSPSYMPPEQARGEISSLSPRSDLYSLGAILYQLLTGRPPYLTDNPISTVLQVINSDPVQPRELQPGIPLDLETICCKALQKESSARYQSCQELAGDLQRFLNGEPILARPIGRVEKSWRWCRRNPRIAIPSSLAMMFVVSTAIVSLWAWATTSAQAAIIAEQRDEAREQRDEANKQRVIAENQRTIANQQSLLAQENEELARKQALLALRNIQFVITEVDGKLRELPGSTDLRLSLLETVSKKWDELDLQLAGGLAGDAVPTLMAVRQQIASAYIDLDQLKSADKESEKLYKQAQGRVELKRASDASRTNLAKVCMLWAGIKSRLDGDPGATIKLYQQATNIVRDVMANPRPEPGSPSLNDIRELLAALLQNQGVEHLKQGRLRTTAESFQEALSLMGKVLEDIRSQPDFKLLDENDKDSQTAAKQISHDKSAIGLAYILMRLGETEQSVEKYEQAILARREIYQRRSSMLPLKLELAGHLGNYSQSMLWMRDLGKAEKLADECVRLFEEIYKSDPEKAEYKRQYATALYRLASVRDLQDRSGESLSLFERCRGLRAELFAVSSDEKNSINLMLAEARVGNIDSVKQLVVQLSSLETKNGERHLERARAMAQLCRVSSGQDRQAMLEAALEALQQAVKDGYTDPFRVEKEPDLEPLAENASYLALIAKMKSDGMSQ